MKKFILALATILLLWLAADRIGAAAMHWVTLHTHERFSAKIRTIVTDVRADIILLGSSRCESHYVPTIIADSTGMSVYNAGLSGAGTIYFQYMTLAHILRRHTPSVVVLDTGESEYATGDDRPEMLTYYAPYIGLCPAADSIYRLTGTLWRHRLSHLYRYHSLSGVALARLLRPDERPDDHGYTPIAAPRHHPTDPGALQQPLPVDSRKTDTFRRFIHLCRRHNVRLILAISPSYSRLAPDYYDTLRNIAAQEHLTLLDYDSPGTYLNHPQYFYDNAHLCQQGAHIFTQHFAHDLKTLISANKEHSAR